MHPLIRLRSVHRDRDRVGLRLKRKKFRPVQHMISTSFRRAKPSRFFFWGGGESIWGPLTNFVGKKGMRSSFLSSLVALFPLA